MELYVSPCGNDSWSGFLPEPNEERTDGPLATMAGARDRVRTIVRPPLSMKQPWSVDAVSWPITVWLREGHYPVTEPILFGPEDSAPVRYAAYKDETPVIDGGVRVSDWKIEEVNGRECWVAELPEVAAGEWDFRQLFVDGERRLRTRLPKEGVYWMEDVPGLKLPTRWGPGKCESFICAEGDVQAWKNIRAVEVVALHWWIEERFPVVSFDPDSRLVKLGRTSRAPLADDRNQRYARYYVENVFEALAEPGQWYLDRPEGKLYYLPKPGEDPETTEVFAPRALQLIEIIGEPETNRFVEYLHFQGLTFQHTDWRHPGEDEAADTLGVATSDTRRRYGRGEDAAASQAACDVPGVIYLEGARCCIFEDCSIRNVGWYGIEIADGCTSNTVVGNNIYDLGAGGVKLNGTFAQGERCRQTGLNRVTDNNIQSGGRVFHSAIGVLSMHSYGNIIAHNHIHDFFYTGISCGWIWGYAESVSRDNLIEKNHIHQIGQGMLSDMGGVYLLGVQPGTVVRGNLIHDIEKANYGGWCLYTDEGSSHIVLKDNVCYDTNSEIFHQHYGRENTVRNNIFAFGGENLFAYTRVEPHVGLNLTRNIIITDGPPISVKDYGPNQRRINSDLNLFWHVSGDEPVVNAPGGDQPTLDLQQWQALGYDLHSILADPKCADPKGRDFSLADDSPAYQLGFKPIDLSDVGPRLKGERSL